MGNSSPWFELLTGSAHSSVPTDVTVPLGERFRGKGVLVVVVAKERAAVVRVRFSDSGAAQVVGSRSIENRAKDLGEVLSVESKAFGTQDVVLCVALGWFLDLGVCSTRRDAQQTAFAPFSTMLEMPQDVLPGAKTEFVYTAINHPTQDKSVVFSVRRADVHRFMDEVGKCGLRVVAVRCPVAALLEVWLARKGSDGVKTDLLVSDGLSACYLNVEAGAFVAPKADHEDELVRPRQSTARPNDVINDMLHFVKEGHANGFTFLGQRDSAETLQQDLADAGLTMVVPAEPGYDDATLACLAPEVMHDLNPLAKEERPRIPVVKRKLVLSFLAGVALLVLVLGFHIYSGVASNMDADEAERRASAADQRERGAASAIAAAQLEKRNAEWMRAWIQGNLHVQQFMVDFIGAIPPSSAVESVTTKLQDGSAQMSLTFTLLASDQSQQEECTRRIENVLIERGFKVGQREQPLLSGRTISYTWRLILPEVTK